MLDLSRTLNLIRGGLFDPEKTWQDYLPDADDWQKTAFLLTGPLIVIAALGAYLVSFLGSDVTFFGRFRPTLVSTLVTMVMSAIGAAVVAFIVSALAGAFGGNSSFARGLAATTLAFIPGYIGQALLWFPWVGGLLSLGLSIYGLVLLWKIIPVYHAVPDSKRVGHFILAIVGAVVAMIFLSITVNRITGPRIGAPSIGAFSDRTESGSAADGGLYSGLARQAELIAAAEEDRYDPPSDGRVGEGQVREFLRVMQRAEELQQQRMKNLEQLAEKAENEEQVSFRDLGAMMGGMTEVAGLQTSEIEVVKSAGGNWAEHQWVRETLRTAWIQKDVSDAVAHNYALYQENEEELAPYITY